MTSHSPDRIEGAPLIRPSTTDHPLYDDVVNACRTVFDPEIPVNIYDLGLVYTVEISPENEVAILMTLTAPGCGMGPAIAADAQSKLMSVSGVDGAAVDLVWEPAWNQGMISEEGRMILGLV